MEEEIDDARTLNTTTKNNVVYRVLLFIRMINTSDPKEFKRIRKELTNNK